MAKSTAIKAETETTTAGNNPVKFPIEKLRSNCVKLFKVTTSTFDGATSGMTGEYTVSEIRGLLESWGKKEVK